MRESALPLSCTFSRPQLLGKPKFCSLVRHVRAAKLIYSSRFQAYDAFDQVAAGGSDDDWIMDPSDVDLYIPTSMLLVFICFSLASIAAVYVKYRSNVTRNRIISQQSISADVDS